MRQKRGLWQKFKNHVDKVELKSLTNLIDDLIRQFRMMKFVDVQRQAMMDQFVNWPIESKPLITMITHLSKEGMELYLMP